MFEVELKFLLEDPNIFWEMLNRWNVSFDSETLEEDFFYQHPDRDFSQTDECLRIRRRNNTLFLTYKGPKIDQETKTRLELEFPLLLGANSEPNVQSQYLNVLKESRPVPSDSSISECLADSNFLSNTEFFPNAEVWSNTENIPNTEISSNTENIPNTEILSDTEDLSILNHSLNIDSKSNTKNIPNTEIPSNSENIQNTEILSVIKDLSVLNHSSNIDGKTNTEESLLEETLSRWNQLLIILGFSPAATLKKYRRTAHFTIKNRSISLTLDRLSDWDQYFEQESPDSSLDFSQIFFSDVSFQTEKLPEKLQNEVQSNKVQANTPLTNELPLNEVRTKDSSSFLPFVFSGNFVEIETLSKNQEEIEFARTFLKEIAQKLGLKYSLRKSYLEIQEQIKSFYKNHKNSK